MTNIISKDVFTVGMKRLEVAFMKDIPKATLKLYYEKLKGFDNKGFNQAVEHIIDIDDFFPSIARFRRSPMIEDAIFREEIKNQPSLEEMIS